MLERPPGGATQQPQPSGNVKGTLLIARMKFLRAQGKIEIEEVLRRLPSDDRGLLQGLLLPSTWYPAELLMRLETAIAAVVARGDRARAFTAMGRFAAQANLGPGGVQRPYLREDDPHYLLERLPRMYVSQHTSGRRTYERIDERSATVRSFECEPHSDDCFFVVGWLQRAIELSGGNDVSVLETQCHARGAPHCEYRARWS